MNHDPTINLCQNRPPIYEKQSGPNYLFYPSIVIDLLPPCMSSTVACLASIYYHRRWALFRLLWIDLVVRILSCNPFNMTFERIQYSGLRMDILDKEQFIYSFCKRLSADRREPPLHELRYSCSYDCC